jgi:hypothetical protein
MMKKFLLLFLLSAEFAFAQLPVGYAALYPNSFSDTCFVNTSSNRYAEYRYNYPPSYPTDSGYVFGTNVYGQTEFVQVYQKNASNGITANAACMGVQALYSSLVSNNNSNTFAKIYNVNPITNEPTTLIATSTAVPMDSINVVNFYTYYPLTTPILYSALPNKFAVAFVAPTGLNDSLGVYSTVSPCGGGDSLVWMKQANGTWIDVKSWFTVSFKADLHIHAVFDNTASISTVRDQKYFSITLNENMATLSGSDLSTIKELVFTDISGKRLSALASQSGKNLSYQFNDLQKGVYAARLITKDNQIFNYKLIK